MRPGKYLSPSQLFSPGTQNIYVVDEEPRHAQIRESPAKPTCEAQGDALNIKISKS